MVAISAKADTAITASQTHTIPFVIGKPSCLIFVHSLYYTTCRPVNAGKSGKFIPLPGSKSPAGLNFSQFQTIYLLVSKPEYAEEQGEFYETFSFGECALTGRFAPHDNYAKPPERMFNYF
jgi:hypothetical protein